MVLSPARDGKPKGIDRLGNLTNIYKIHTYGSNFATCPFL